MMPSPAGPTSPSPLLPVGLTREFLHQARICPTGVEEAGVVQVLAAPPVSAAALCELEIVFGRLAHVTVSDAAAVERAIERLAATTRVAPTGAADTRPRGGVVLGTDIRELASKPPVVRYVNLLVADAFESGASDIHLDSRPDGSVEARVRLDGVLHPVQPPPPDAGLAVVSRLKLLAEMDPAERRRPQDGRVRLQLEQRELDLRISTVPSIHGESVVVRLLDHGGRPVTLGELGMSRSCLESTERIAALPHGLFIVTGPTGSGKTTTLHAFLSSRPRTTEKVVTVEDPVEYQLEGVTQVPVHRAAGVTFAAALRSILRQDPDVLMVGEMRDQETAEIAVQAAMTGHLVFSTLHTNDALGVVPRLRNLGVPSYLIASTLEGVLSQRLARRICSECAGAYTPDPAQVSLLTGKPAGARRHLRGAGCPRCRMTGYRGRIGLFELMPVGDALRDAILRQQTGADLEGAARANGIRTLREDAWAKVSAGQTTVEEVLRVAGH